MSIKKGGTKKPDRFDKATAFDSDMYKKDKQKKSMTSDNAYRVNLKNGGSCAQIKGFGKARRPNK